MTKVRTRFAPSPTGYLHIGGLRTALYGYMFAKANDGDFILRIEDTDQTRYVDGAVELIYETLNTCGLCYDEGPFVGGEYGPYVQSERKEIYLEYAKKLVELGGAYYCFCTKEDLESQTDENGNRKYNKKCLNLSKEEIEKNLQDGVPYVIRQNIPTSGKSSYTDLVFGEVVVDCADMEDGVLIKSDKMPTYNFANVIDDYLMQINYVMRGTEYLSSTPKYNLLYDSFAWQRPNYIHMPPIMKNSKEKLSKRHGDASFSDFIKSGYIKEAIINYIALLGWSPKENIEKMSFEKMKEMFSIEGISKSPAIFDPLKLKWLNGEYIKAMTDEEFLSYAKPYLDNSLIANMYDYLKIAKLLKTRVDVLVDIAPKIEFLASMPDFSNELYTHKKMKTDLDIAKLVLPKALEVVKKIEDYTFENIHDDMIKLADVLALEHKQVLWCFRIAITGMLSTPGGAIEMADILGKDKVIERLIYSIERL